MSQTSSKIESSSSDEAFQQSILPHVSRTFALTIPLLPPELRAAVTTAYLSCRIADTIEDELPLASDETLLYLHQYSEAIAGRYDPERLGREVAQHLREGTSPAERELVRNTARVVRVVRCLGPRNRAAICRCVEVMCDGMHRFQSRTCLYGLESSSDLDAYCYYVAGVVGEMLAAMFCAYSEKIRWHGAALVPLARSFGQGLQMTNILKDQWEDRGRGACWLPRDVFQRHGVDLATLQPGQTDRSFHAGLRELIGVAHSHLRDALAFSLLIPPEERGIRSFCLWAIGLAVLTLQRICRNPGFTAGEEVKVSHAAVLLVRVGAHLAGQNDQMLRRLFDLAAHGLPLAHCELHEPATAAFGAALGTESDRQPP